MKEYILFRFSHFTISLGHIVVSKMHIPAFTELLFAGVRCASRQ